MNLSTLLTLPFKASINLNLSDAMLSEIMRENGGKLIQDISVVCHNQYFTLTVKAGIGILAKSFSIDLVIKEIILDKKCFLIKLYDKNHSLDALKLLAKIAGLNRFKEVEFCNDEIHVDLSKRLMIYKTEHDDIPIDQIIGQLRYEYQLIEGEFVLALRKNSL
ncbi:MAG: hypothetical protein KA886_00765 [Candidatus Cloacimonetes bacterium]|nr:hypothetical protein [Candidatus Cloacimonadota bacterium]